MPKIKKSCYHFKNNIIEIEPTKKELNIYENIINNYEDKIQKLENEKIIKTKDLNNKFKDCKNKIKERKELNLKENKNKMELELKK